MQIERRQELFEPSRCARVGVGADRLGRGTNLLDEVQQFGTVLARQCITELTSQPADVVPETFIPSLVTHGRKRTVMRPADCDACCAVVSGGRPPDPRCRPDGKQVRVGRRPVAMLRGAVVRVLETHDAIRKTQDARRWGATPRPPLPS